METLSFLMVTTFYPPYHLGGDAVHVRYLAEALAGQGHEVHVEFSPAAYRLKREGLPVEPKGEEDIVQLHPIPSRLGTVQPVGSYLFGQSPSVTRFHARLMHTVRPDVVHHHNISLLGLGVLGGARPERTLLTLHDYWIRCPRSDLLKYGRHPCDSPTCLRCSLVSGRPPQIWRSRRAWKGLRRIDLAIAPSRFMARAMEKEFPGPILHIPNFAPDQNPEGRTWDPGDYYLYVGVQESHKGVMDLAEVAARHPTGPSFIFVGTGTHEKRLRKLQDDGLTNIEIRGRVESAQLADLYRNCRAVVIPSLWHENSPLVAIEALSWGAPLLVSNRGGLEELVESGAGVSFEPTHPGIRASLERFEAEGLPFLLRERARLAYEARHHPVRYLERYMALIHQEGEEAMAKMSEDSVGIDTMGP